MESYIRTKTPKNSEVKFAISSNDDIFEYIHLNKFKEIGNNTLTHLDILIYKPAKFIRNPNEIQTILQHYHDSPTGGHLGINRLYKKLKNIYEFPNMKYRITRFVKSCESCKQNKHFTPIQAKFIKTTTPTKVFDVVSIDTIGPFTLTEKGSYKH